MEELIISTPGSYTIQSGDRVEYKIKVSANLKGIYTQDSMRNYGSDQYAIVRVYTGEAGTARAYMVYHYGSTSGSTPEASNWIGDEKFAQTADYYDKTATMSKSETLYLNGLNAREYLSNVVASNASLYFG